MVKTTKDELDAERRTKILGCDIRINGIHFFYSLSGELYTFVDQPLLLFCEFSYIHGKHAQVQHSHTQAGLNLDGHTFHLIQEFVWCNEPLWLWWVNSDCIISCRCSHPTSHNISHFTLFSCSSSFCLQQQEHTKPLIAIMQIARIAEFFWPTLKS